MGMIRRMIEIYLRSGLAILVAMSFSLIILSFLEFAALKFNIDTEFIVLLPSVQLTLDVLLLVLFSFFLLSLARDRKIKYPWQGSFSELLFYIGFSWILAEYRLLNKPGLDEGQTWALGFPIFVLIFFILPGAFEVIYQARVRSSGEGTRLRQTFINFLFAILLVVGIVIVGERQYRHFVDTRPMIISFEPKVVSAGSLVLVRGTDFGYKQGEESQVISANGHKMEIVSWTPNLIVFRLDTWFDPGEIRIISPFTFRNLKKVKTSNPIQLEYYDAANASEGLQRRYFDQLGQMSQEGKRLYGISK